MFGLKVNTWIFFLGLARYEFSCSLIKCALSWFNIKNNLFQEISQEDADKLLAEDEEYAYAEYATGITFMFSRQLYLF